MQTEMSSRLHVPPHHTGRDIDCYAPTASSFCRSHAFSDSPGVLDPFSQWDLAGAFPAYVYPTSLRSLRAPPPTPRALSLPQDALDGSTPNPGRRPWSAAFPLPCSWHAVRRTACSRCSEVLTHSRLRSHRETTPRGTAGDQVPTGPQEPKVGAGETSRAECSWPSRAGHPICISPHSL